MECIELDAVIDEFDEAERMPIKPDVKPLSITHIFDENMSVKWNREQVEEHNKNLGIMRSEMMQAKYRARENVRLHIIQYLYQEWSNISLTKIEKLYNKVFNEEYDRDYRIRDVIEKCEEYLEIFASNEEE